VRFAQPHAIETIARIRFAWDTDLARCRAIAFGFAGVVLGEVIVDLPPATKRQIHAAREGSAQFRVEDIAERHLRAMLELRQ